MLPRLSFGSARPLGDHALDINATTRFAGGSEVISQASEYNQAPGDEFLSTILDSAEHDVSNLFTFYKPKSKKKPGLVSSVLQLNLQQHNVLYALAGCSDVTFIMSRVKKEVRVGINKVYSIDSKQMCTWFKNRRVVPKTPAAACRRLKKHQKQLMDKERVSAQCFQNLSLPTDKGVKDEPSLSRGSPSSMNLGNIIQEETQSDATLSEATLGRRSASFGGGIADCPSGPRRDSVSTPLPVVFAEFPTESVDSIKEDLNLIKEELDLDQISWGMDDAWDGHIEPEIGHADFGHCGTIFEEDLELWNMYISMTSDDQEAVQQGPDLSMQVSDLRKCTGEREDWHLPDFHHDALAIKDPEWLTTSDFGYLAPDQAASTCVHPPSEVALVLGCHFDKVARWLGAQMGCPQDQVSLSDAALEVVAKAWLPSLPPTPLPQSYKRACVSRNDSPQQSARPGQVRLLPAQEEFLHDHDACETWTVHGHDQGKQKATHEQPCSFNMYEPQKPGCNLTPFTSEQRYIEVGMAAAADYAHYLKIKCETSGTLEQTPRKHLGPSLPKGAADHQARDSTRCKGFVQMHCPRSSQQSVHKRSDNPSGPITPALKRTLIETADGVNIKGSSVNHSSILPALPPAMTVVGSGFTSLY